MVKPDYSKTVPFLLSILVIFVLGIILRELSSILLPFVIAVFLSIIFGPLVTYLKQKRVPTFIALLVVLFSIASFLFLLAMVVSSSVDSFVKEVPKYQERLLRLGAAVALTLNQLAADLNVKMEEVSFRNAFELSSLTSTVATGIGSFINLLTNIFLVLLFMVFILAGTGELSIKIRKAFPLDQADRIMEVLEKIGNRSRRYLVTKTFISAATGLMTFLILWILGVDFPLVWGFVTFLLNFIPNLGSLIAIILPFALSLLQFDSLQIPVLVLILLSATQFTLGSIIEPRLMAFRLNLSPLLVLVSLIFWGWLWGIVGMILAVPIMATVKIIFESIEALQPISVFMGRHIKMLE
ncbi:MAG: AI-2E family transporter [Ignavibacteria bacterium]|nr:AI-2E family transporter [Ignavibacteria bacterium]